MKPLETLESGRNVRGEDMLLEKRGDVIYLRHKGETISATDAHDADVALAELCCQPLRPARQPQVLIASRGLDAFAEGVRYITLQKRAQIFINPAEKSLSNWWPEHLADQVPDLIEDKRVIHLRSPLDELLTESKDLFHAVLVNLDVMAATNSGDLGLFTTAKGLNRVVESLRDGGMLGISQIEHDPKILKQLRDVGLSVATEDFPICAKARRSRRLTTIIARKGDYQSQNRSRR